MKQIVPTTWMLPFVLTMATVAGMPGLAHAQQVSLRGQVISRADSLSLPGASIRIPATETGAIADAQGHFTLQVVLPVTLQVSFIGYKTEEITITTLPDQRPVHIFLTEDARTLGEIMVVSTGYQDLPMERVTGSFVQMDEDILHRNVSPDLIGRMEGLLPGLAVTRYGFSQDLTIRGVSTLFANKEPLVIVDNFPYEGSIQNLNPNDIASVTVLRDAAAASIWGARAGNGVIVITTRQGKESMRPRVQWNSNITFGDAIDPYWMPRISVGDHLQIERELFQIGYFTANENSNDKLPLTEAAEWMVAHRDGLISEQQLEQELARLAAHDVRDDLRKYVYQTSVHRQNSLQLSGGSSRHKYFVSVGHDQASGRRVGDENTRFTFNARQAWDLIPNKLRVQADAFWIHANTQRNGLDPSELIMTTGLGSSPYARLADAQGNPMPIIKDYRQGFVESAEAAGLLDWKFRPLEEIRIRNNTETIQDIRLQTELEYKALPHLRFSVRYQYWGATQNDREYFSQDAYFTRNLINRFTQVNPNGTFTHGVPVGGILQFYNRERTGHNGRAQVDYEKRWGRHHEVFALGGFEVRDTGLQGHRGRFYGYDEEVAVSARVNYQTLYNMYHNPARTESVPFWDVHTGTVDRFVSWYGNGSYIYKQRYILSLSGRKDMSNLFGVAANQRGVPLWSAGLSWNIHEEDFFPWKETIPFLKLRTTYGYNGNIDRSVSAATTARVSGTSFNTGQQFAVILNPPNENLRWERIEVVNLGLDWAIRNRRLSGSVEYFVKNGLDLIGQAPVSFTTGMSNFRGNVASTSGRGWDIVVRSVNMEKPVRWETQYFYSRAVTEVSDYEMATGAFQLVSAGAQGSFPRQGFPLYAMYSYRFAGLSAVNGNPMGYNGNEPTDNYAQLINGAQPDSLQFHGSSRPLSFGGLLNTFTYKNWSLSFNITYSLGYYFRRPSILYGFNRGMGGHGDYANRWQQPGDEDRTTVPSVPATGNTLRDNFYRYSSALVDRADNIRLQDVQVSYRISKRQWKALPVEHAEVYAYARNLGILWKATDTVPDPDNLEVNMPRTLALGVRINF